MPGLPGVRPGLAARPGGGQPGGRRSGQYQGSRPGGQPPPATPAPRRGEQGPDLCRVRRRRRG